MKKLVVLYISIVLAIVACDFTANPASFFGDSDSLVVNRYDRLQYRYLTSGDFSALQQMNTDYPIETRMLIEDILKLGSVNDRDIYKSLLTYYQDSTLQTIMRDVQAEFSDMTDINEELRKSFRRMKDDLPELETPHFYAQMGALDQSVIVGEGSVCVSLDKYLGKDYSIYSRYYNEEQRKSMTREYIVPDCLIFYLISKYPMTNFENRSQYDRDMHLSCLMWLVNKYTHRQLFENQVSVVEAYMKEHPKTTAKDLLGMTDYTAFRKYK